jgi:hypothetical protein
MRGTLLTALAVAFILSGSVPARDVAAAMIGPGSAARAAPALAAVIERVANVCGANGCVPVQTKRIIHRQKPGTVAGNHI